MSVLLVTSSVTQRFLSVKILGFGPTGKPILPPAANSNDPETIRRKKMGWEEISRQASKIISFSGEHTAWSQDV